MHTTRAGPPSRRLNGLNHVLDVLELYAQQGRDLGVSEVSAMLALSKGTVHSIVSNLHSRGYLRRLEPTGKYRLGLKLWEFSTLMAAQLELRDIARPQLEGLTDLTGESALLAVYDAGDSLYLDKVTSPNPVQAYTRIGGRAPAYCVATGKALLAFQPEAEIVSICTMPLTAYTSRTITRAEDLYAELARVRASGYATNAGEWRGEVVGVAAPVRDDTGRVVAAISVAGPSYRFSIDQALDYVPQLLRSAATISRQLGWKSDSSISATQVSIESR